MISGRRVAQALDPGQETGLEQVRVERVDHVVERVVRRDPALVGQEPAQKIKPLLTPQRRSRRNPPSRPAWRTAPGTGSPAADTAPARRGASRPVADRSGAIRPRKGGRRPWAHSPRSFIYEQADLSCANSKHRSIVFSIGNP